MSAITTKAKKNGSKGKAAQTQIEALLAQTSIEHVPFNKLARSELNARKQKPSVLGIVELACTIASVGLLHNLVVYLNDENKFGVVCGGRRLSGLELLNNPSSVDEAHADFFKTRLKELGLENEKQIIPDEYLVAVKIVSKDIAEIISLIENEQREAMHPSDQLQGFRRLSEKGYEPSKIAELMGYSTKHVRKCLRLTTMAPTLLEQLSEDKISLSQLQALSASEDHECQLNAWENSYYKSPESLRQSVLRGEINAEESDTLKLVGRECYEANGGTFRYDLFTDQGFICDVNLLERLAREKLSEIAKDVALNEGWSWSEGRMIPVKSWGEDNINYKFIPTPKPIYSDDQVNKIKQLEEEISKLDTQLLDSEEEDEEIVSLKFELYEKLEQLEDEAIIQAWSSEIKKNAGVVVSLVHGEVNIQRGIELKHDEAEEVTEKSNNDQSPIVNTEKEKISYSEKLIKSLSSERTIAVQAALTKRVDIALPYLAYALITSHFATYNRACLMIKAEKQIHYIQSNVPTIEESKAFNELAATREKWEARFPDGWENNFEWLLDWSQEDLIAIISYCTAACLTTISWQLINGQAGREALAVEKALSFDMREYWQPTAVNYFERLNKHSIANSLIDAGLETIAAQVSGMKKREAAQIAEQAISKTDWIPACLYQSDDKNDVSNDVE